MTIYTYQSVKVLRILKSGQVYRAQPSLKYGRAYDCLVDMLGLRCQCPIFGNLRFHRKNIGGSTSTSVKLILKVPKENVWLTEYSEWADFMYMVQFTSPKDYHDLVAGEVDDITREKLHRTIESLKQQKNPWSYRVPQAILEEIRPEWLTEYKVKT